jgi:hypothetical protein
VFTVEVVPVTVRLPAIVTVVAVISSELRVPSTVTSLKVTSLVVATA